MKWKRSRKAKEQATGSAQSEAERLRSGGKTATDKTDENRRPPLRHKDTKKVKLNQLCGVVTEETIQA
uniref:Uncharacterized protein n=1 Tax=Lates calcarifer TaxID=8187 RepID=A0A4W6CKT6_LATCA